MSNIIKKAKVKEFQETGKCPGCDLSGANLKGFEQKKGLLAWLGLEKVKVDLENADLEGADMRGAKMSHADMSGANMSNANLENANFEGARNLEKVQSN